jgi:hypothetical protein
MPQQPNPTAKDLPMVEVLVHHAEQGVRSACCTTNQPVPILPTQQQQTPNNKQSTKQTKIIKQSHTATT